MLSSHQLTRIEPHARGVAALHSPETGVVDFGAVARSLAGELEGAGVPVVTSCAVLAVRRSPGALLLRHAHGETRAGFAVFCAGQDASRLAVAAGASADPRIVGFRGRYRYLRPERRELVRGLIYPVPDPRLPFLGVHLTRHVDGNVSLGPTATPEPRTPGDLAWPGTWRMARRFWRAGGAEIRRSLSERAMTRPARSYLPGIRTRDLEGGFSGLRAQAVARDGRLVDDFAVSETEHALHVRNAPSPAATAAFALARLIVDRAAPRLD
jgi:2-hydroxyglutarate dehydrogenase